MRSNRPKHRDLPDGARRRANARAYANTAQRRGRLTPKPCEHCGAPDAEKHRHDYSRPLAVRWLCADCHRGLHAGLLPIIEVAVA